MSQERISELKGLLFNLEQRMRPLEWDSSRHQINDFKKIQLGKLKEEFSTLQNELQQLEQQ
ncbi:hypothetical protein HZC30_01325 [Candidatus Woesearchaeota archaeon]|nr:hypothetical protein [Candidatus Woesearchaeota archaeon]